MAAVQTFRRPILSSIYVVAAWAMMIVGGLSSIGLLLRAGEIVDNVPAAGTCFAVSLSVGIGLLGIAQIFDFIGRCAFHAERIDAMLCAQGNRPQAPSPSTASRSVSDDAPRLTGLASSATAACPSCMAELDVRSLRRGSNRCPACRVEFVAE